MSPALLPPIIFLSLSFLPASPSKAGFVIGAPHGGYDQHTETIVRSLGSQLRWGWVTAIGYRSVPYRQWYDVNRPTERPYVGDGRFGEPRETAEARAVYRRYQQRLQQAADPNQSGQRVSLLVEIHGHARRVSTGSGTLEVEVIELATSGFTTSELRRLQDRYEALSLNVPEHLRVPLAVDRLDARFEQSGWLVPFHFTALGAKNNGSMRPSLADRSLHFELPRRLRNTATARRHTASLLANLLRELE